SFYFNPQTERDGIWLMGENDPEVIENRDILEQAFLLYKDMIDDIETKSFKNVYNIAKTKIPSTDEKYFDTDWYGKYIQSPLRKYLLTKSIVEQEDGKNGKLNELWFPLKSYTKEVKEKLWQYTYDLFPQSVCKKDDIHNWTDIIWDDVSKITFAE